MRDAARTIIIGGGALLVGVAAYTLYRVGRPVAEIAGKVGNYVQDPGQFVRDFQNGIKDIAEATIPGEQPEWWGSGTVERLPLTVALNNPGAIRFDPNNNWVGSPNISSLQLDPPRGNGSGFEVFQTADHGARAMLYLLRRYVNEGHNTLRTMIGRYAPSEGSSGGYQYSNSTDRYIQQVTFETGLDPDQILTANRETLAPIARAMSFYEAGGAQAVPERWRDIWFWYNAWGLL